MPIPEPTRVLIGRLRRAALLLDAVAANAKTTKAYTAANDAANALWLGINRIEELAIAVEDLTPPPFEDLDDAPTL